MPVTCIVVDCGSRGDRDHFLSFFRIPSVKNSVHYPELNDLSRKRREMWIESIKREDLTESILKNQRICSRHFITGKPSALNDENNPDWVPSKHMGHVQSPAHSKRKTDMVKKSRAGKRMKLSNQSSEPRDLCNEESVSEGEGIEDGCGTQTDLTMTMLTNKLELLDFTYRKLLDLQNKVESKVETTPLGLMDDLEDIEKWNYYTGFSYEFINVVIFPEIEYYVTPTSTIILSSFNQLLLTLVKLKLNLQFQDLAFRFNVAATLASSFFQEIIHIMYVRFRSLIFWPDSSESELKIPLCFTETFEDKTTVIIDCFEICIEKPENYLTQQQCWSRDKHHHTIKFLFGITPLGTICYISKGWGGLASDKQIVELSDFCDFIKPGDVVLADRGFVIEDTLGIFEEKKVVIPAFTKGKSLHPLDFEATEHIAHIRIHLEEIIGVIKNEFSIFEGPLPVSMLKIGDDEICSLDEIVTVCSALINMQPSRVPP